MTPIEIDRSSRSAPAGSVSAPSCSRNAVDLVGDEADPRLGARRGETPPVRLGGQHPGRVVRRIDDDHPRLGPEGADQAIDVERPAVLLAQRVERDVARRRRARPRTATGSPGHVTMTWSPGLDRRAEQAEDRLLGAGEDEDVVGLERLVQRGDLARAAADGRSTPCSRGAGPSHIARVSSSASSSSSAIDQPSTSLAPRTCSTANSQRAK